MKSKYLCAKSQVKPVSRDQNRRRQVGRAIFITLLKDGEVANRVFSQLGLLLILNKFDSGHVLAGPTEVANPRTGGRLERIVFETA